MKYGDSSISQKNFRIQDTGCRMQDSEFIFRDLFRIQDSGFRIHKNRIQDSGFKIRIQDSGFRMQDA